MDNSEEKTCFVPVYFQDLVKKSTSEDLTLYDIVGDILGCTNSSQLELDYEKQYDRGSCQTLLCPRWVLRSEVTGQS